MANPKSGQNKSGCGTWIAVVVVFALVVFVIGKIAQGFTTVAIWMQHGSAGLPDPTDRSPAYGLAWGLFFAVLAAIGLAVAVVKYELNRRRRFAEFVATLKPPVGPA